MFELFSRYEDFFLLDNYMPNKTNIQELKNLISKKAEENKEKSENDLKRLNEIINKSEAIKNNDDSSIKIKEKYNAQTRKIDMVFNFLRFCKKYLNPFAHASGENINYYSLPESLIDFDLDYDCAKYLLALDDILSKEINPDEEESVDPTIEINFPNEFNICKKEKKLQINEVVKIFLADKIEINYLNNKFPEEIKEKKKCLNESLAIFEKKSEAFFGIGIKQYSIKELSLKLKSDFLESNKNFLVQFDIFDSIISDIFTPGKKFSKEMQKNIEIIKEIIDSEVCTDLDLLEEVKKFSLDIDDIDAFLSDKIFRLAKILEFLYKQKEKALKSYKDLYENYEKNLKEIIEKVKSLSKIVNNKYNFQNLSLLEKWKKTRPKISKKYLQIKVLRKNLMDLIENIQLNINYSYDDEFLLWVINNKFSNYLMN